MSRYQRARRYALWRGFAIAITVWSLLGLALLFR